MGLHRVSVSVSDEEFKDIQAAAKSQYCSVNQLLNRIILDGLDGVQQAEKEYWKEREMRYLEKYIECTVNNILKYTLDNLGLTIADQTEQLKGMEVQMKSMQKEIQRGRKPVRGYAWKKQR